jgi:cell division protein FtsZ
VNITGGADLTLGEVHQINEIVHDAVGDDAEIIFGAVHEPAMQGEIRVTVIATGFDRAMPGAAGAAPAQPEPVQLPRGAPVIPFPTQRPARVGSAAQRATPAELPRRPAAPAPPERAGRRADERASASAPAAPEAVATP